MQYAYGIVFLLTASLIPLYLIGFKKTKYDPWLILFLVSVTIVNLGYLLISISKTVEFALFANKIAYLGQTIIPMAMFMIISKLCGFKLKKTFVVVLIGCAVAIFAMVCTTGHLDWYYTNVTIENVAGATILNKEYGFLHPFNLIYVVLYFLAMVVVIAISFKKKDDASQKHACIMLIIVLGNIAMWLVQKVIPWDFEMLSISYLMSAGAFLAVWFMLQDYVLKKDVPVYTPKEQERLGVGIGIMPMEEKIKKVLCFVREGEILGSREREILELILINKKRKDIASELFLSENTVKTYTRTLYSKLGVTCREELYSLLLQNKNEK